MNMNPKFQVSVASRQSSILALLPIMYTMKLHNCTAVIWRFCHLQENYFARHKVNHEKNVVLRDVELWVIDYVITIFRARGCHSKIGARHTSTPWDLLYCACKIGLSLNGLRHWACKLASCWRICAMLLLVLLLQHERWCCMSSSGCGTRSSGLV